MIASWGLVLKPGKVRSPRGSTPDSANSRFCRPVWRLKLSNPLSGI